MATKPVVIRFFAPVIDATVNTLMSTVDQKMKQWTKDFIILVSSPGGSVIHGLSAYNYLKDLLEIFEEEGWDWAYHAYREWHGWSLEHTAADREHIQKDDWTDRLDLFKSYFK